MCIRDRGGGGAGELAGPLQHSLAAAADCDCVTGAEPESWPGPFSTARQLKRGQAKAKADREAHLGEAEAAAAAAEVEWNPSGSAKGK
eukprot:114021-Prorocentrum_minimum.AAC.1